jgi:1D-myo-inositol-tetrakisphosphate 5-kinase/inositol-polyphosphate multikinase
MATSSNGSQSPIGVPLEYQMGGHKGVLSSTDGSVVIKPCLPQETEFYNAAFADPQLENLRTIMPTFYGTLRLQGRVDLDASGAVSGDIKPLEQDVEEKDKPIIMALPFLNILY